MSLRDDLADLDAFEELLDRIAAADLVEATAIDARLLTVAMQQFASIRNRANTARAKVCMALNAQAVGV